MAHQGPEQHRRQRRHKPHYRHRLKTPCRAAHIHVMASGRESAGSRAESRARSLLQPCPAHTPPPPTHTLARAPQTRTGPLEPCSIKHQCLHNACSIKHLCLQHQPKSRCPTRTRRTPSPRSLVPQGSTWKVFDQQRDPVSHMSEPPLQVLPGLPICFAICRSTCSLFASSRENQRVPVPWYTGGPRKFIGKEEVRTPGPRDAGGPAPNVVATRNGSSNRLGRRPEP